ncbi:MAG: trypsin-like peptidase domain-containing protein [Deltaproteobacteria bacterium]|nr:trypsin-like peptidase domain-containing protein [Deltaproteobacteria bacterium]
MKGFRLPSPASALPALSLLAALAAAACSPAAGVPQPSPAPGTAPPPPAPACSQSAATAGPPLPSVPPPLALSAVVPAVSSVADLVEKVAPTVVNITTVQKLTMPDFGPFEFFFGHPERLPRPEQVGAGSGFIIDPAGFVVTNEHVVRGADEVKVRLLDKRSFDAEVVGRDRKLDLALLRLRGASDLPAASLGESAGLRVGEHVLAVGNPFGLGHTVTLGIVSAKARSIGAGPYDDFIQTDASINPGNSGGPLFDLRGQVVGINTAIRAGAEGIGFATPVEALLGALPQLKAKGYVERGKLGLVFQPVSDEIAAALGLDRPRGALVSEIEPGGAAAKASIQPGDLIVAVDDVQIRDAEELPRNVARHAPGSRIRVTLLRQGRTLAVSATLDTLEEEHAPVRRQPSAGAEQKTEKMRGVEIADHPEGGVRVVAVDAGAPKGIEPGDVIVELAGEPVKNVKQLDRQLAKLPAGGTALFEIRRGARQLFVGVPLSR